MSRRRQFTLVLGPFVIGVTRTIVDLNSLIVYLSSLVIDGYFLNLDILLVGLCLTNRKTAIGRAYTRCDNLLNNAGLTGRFPGRGFDDGGDGVGEFLILALAFAFG